MVVSNWHRSPPLWITRLVQRTIHSPLPWIIWRSMEPWHLWRRLQGWAIKIIRVSITSRRHWLTATTGGTWRREPLISSKARTLSARSNRYKMCTCLLNLRNTEGRKRTGFSQRVRQLLNYPQRPQWMTLINPYLLFRCYSLLHSQRRETAT